MKWHFRMSVPADLILSVEVEADDETEAVKLARAQAVKQIKDSISDFGGFQVPYPPHDACLYPHSNEATGVPELEDFEIEDLETIEQFEYER